LASLNNGLEWHGIYKLEGDALTVCHGIERPLEFRESERQQALYVFHRQSREAAALAPEYPNAPGCYWTIEPKGAMPGALGGSGINVLITKDPQGALVVNMSYVTKLDGRKPNPEYRPVFFDDKKARYLVEAREEVSGASPAIRGVTLVTCEFRLDPKVLPFDRVKGLGIEVVSAEVLRAEADALSAKAFQSARDAGIELLPRPEVGKPYEFMLTASDGKALRSDAMKGKVVLIDCWASWSGPCTDKMAELKALYERRRGDGFEVIGLNFDFDRTRGERLVKALALPWPQVFVPVDDRTRRLWADGPGFPSYPRLLLIDRQGILRWDGGSPESLDERTNAMLDAPRPGK
jgi:thiol-disulfide isomerase/thioredoxin